ncbi:MAG: alpha/beta hydrolase [Pseudomonadota bacterium]
MADPYTQPTRTRHLLDEELLPLLELVPAAPITDANLGEFRAAGQARQVLADAAAAGVVRERVDTTIDGQPVAGLLYRPEGPPHERPAYLHVHGGGYIMGATEGSDPGNVALCAALDIVIFSVDYRLAPEHPIPAPLDDCYAALAWLHHNCESLHVDPRRIAVGGESAGGGLAAALAIRARDAGDYAICHQQLVYPMLDNLTGSDAEPGDPLVGEFVWSRQRNQYGWASYLGSAPATAPQVPARVESCAGLPSTWLFTAQLDLFRDENLSYAQRLMAAGVAVDLVLYAGACHGFQLLPGTRLGRRFIAEHKAALAHGLGLAD